MNIKLILKWSAGIILLFAALIALTDGGLLSTFFFALGGLICIPPTFSRLEKLVSFQAKRWHKYAAVIATAILGMIAIPEPDYSSPSSSGGYNSTPSPSSGSSSSSSREEEKKEKKNCSDAERYADDAATYANRAYNSSELDDAQGYARQAKNAADDAKRAADNCDCDDARRYASNAYDYANRAYNASDLDDAKNYARQAKGEAESAKREADDCNDEYKD